MTSIKIKSHHGDYGRPGSHARLFIDNQRSILDDFMDRVAGKRPTPTRETKAAIAAALAKTLGREVKLSWSRFAGCSMCPCSPGFIIKGVHGQWFRAEITK